MKKLLLFILLIPSICFAEPDVNIIVEHTDGINDGQITTKSTSVESMIVCYKGVNIGDGVSFFDNTAATDTNKVLTLIASTANGCNVLHFSPTAAYFRNGIYYHSVKASGTFTVDIQSY